MKRQIVIFLLLSIQVSSHGQKFFRLNSSPCTDKTTDTIKGKWVKGENILSPQHIGLNKEQVQEALNRLDAIHKLALEAYPDPVGVAASWHHNLGYSTFADQVKYEMNENGMLNANPVKENPVAFFYYQAAFFNYFCLKQNEIWSGLNGETSTYLNVYANSLSSLLSNSEYKEDDAAIDGRPIKLRKTAIGKWKGYELYSEGGPGMELYTSRYVLMHRNGELPYIPVTRKQYLERCMTHFNRSFDKMMAELDQVADLQLKKEQRQGMEIQKKDVLKRYQDEFVKTTKEGLLDSAAIISGMFSIYEGDIFVSEAKGGSMLVTENPKYMRKDLPKYIPQLFVLKWSWQPGIPGLCFRKMIEANFPIEKLQAMIEK